MSLLAGAVTATNCGPFSDVDAADPYCPAILQLYVLGLTSGTSPTTFGPAQPVTRQVLALLLARESHAATKARSRRAALGQFWNTDDSTALTLTSVGGTTQFCKADGEFVWFSAGDSVVRLRASDGKLIETWSGAFVAQGVLSAMGKIYVAGYTVPGKLYVIDPRNAAGPVGTLTATLGSGTSSVAFDGTLLWTANSGGSVSMITPDGGTITTVSTGFTTPWGLVYDGSNMWVTDGGAGTLLKLGSNAQILQTVPVGTTPLFPTFDGSQIWVPNEDSHSVSVVNAATGAIVETLSGNGLNFPVEAAFDGERVLVTSANGAVSLWRAADRLPLGTMSTGSVASPWGVCSDGIHFWFAASDDNAVARF
jgi:hypothetical protein